MIEFTQNITHIGNFKVSFILFHCSIQIIQFLDILSFFSHFFLLKMSICNVQLPKLGRIQVFFTRHHHSRDRWLLKTALKPQGLDG